MYAIRVTNQFKKDFKKVRRRHKNMRKLIKVAAMLRQGRRLPLRYRGHQLSGKYKEVRECHIEPDWLLIYYITKNEVWLVRTGTHSDLF